MTGGKDGGKVFQSLNVIEINELIYAFVLFIFNSTRKGYKIFENRVFHKYQGLKMMESRHSQQLLRTKMT